MMMLQDSVYELDILKHLHWADIIIVCNSFKI